MSIAVKTSNRRRHRRVESPMMVAVSGKQCHVDDWSLGGIRLYDCAHDFAKGEVHFVVMRLAGLPQALHARGKVVWADRAGRAYGFEFVDLKPGVAELLKDYMVRHYGPEGAEDTAVPAPKGNVIRFPGSRARV